MFTGLIEEIGTVEQLSRSGEGYSLAVAAGVVMEDLEIGDSVSIDGACQTVVSMTPRSFSVFVSPVTAQVTTLGAFGRGKRVNLERAMSHQGRFGGHIVQGHVDVKGSVVSSERGSRGLSMAITLDRSYLKYIVPKGSVAINGVSLTVVDAGNDGFTLYCIPETLGRTTLGELKRGDEVNVEVDILAKYVERMMSPRSEEKRKEGDKDLKRKLFEEGYS